MMNSFRMYINFIICISILNLVTSIEMAHLKLLSTLITALELRNLTRLPTFAKQFRIIEAGMGESARKSYCEE